MSAGSRRPMRSARCRACGRAGTSGGGFRSPHRTPGSSHLNSPDAVTVPHFFLRRPVTGGGRRLSFPSSARRVCVRGHPPRLRCEFVRVDSEDDHWPAPPSVPAVRSGRSGAYLNPGDAALSSHTGQAVASRAAPSDRATIERARSGGASPRSHSQHDIEEVVYRLPPVDRAGHCTVGVPLRMTTVAEHCLSALAPCCQTQIRMV